MNFQASAVAQGKRFDEQCRWLLADAGWTVSDRPMAVPDCGVEIDCVIEASDTGCAWVEFKGSWRGNRPGLVRTDTVKKAIVTGYLLRSAGYSVPYVVMTSHLPTANSAGETMMRLALKDGVIAAVVCVNGTTWERDLRQAVAAS